ncbi:hypothetical protein [Entomospira culicis]|uniref:Uncharacterized protein n=1 Tax=Entomospira culicis TaxID=2719989 RepID=A0A968GEV2_9SPIO|nr:hypothetical protein [Entomospira culicis]NIZ19034.1 hypothetical protein [Entomospira culicis]NIZ69249.1 hypothetical protein [Entomospira culicis]WDI37833.1 hypothetical protein PVA46_03340 [Entomospira culicis]WDI39461.1 hypothetical protein PVA47_03345 [Entomospira culicis]
MRQDDKKLGKITRWLVLGVVLLIAFFWVGWSEELEITEYRIASEKWQGSQGLTIVVASDLHSTMHGENQSLLITLSNKILISSF